MISAMARQVTYAGVLAEIFSDMRNAAAVARQAVDGLSEEELPLPFDSRDLVWTALRDLHFADTPPVLSARAGALDSLLQRYRRLSQSNASLEEMGSVITIAGVTGRFTEEHVQEGIQREQRPNTLPPH